MTRKDFDGLLDARLDKCREVLAAKAAEYATGTDRLHNFKRAAAVLDTTPADACFCFMTKHMVSVSDMVIATKTGGKPDREAIDEKVGDAINYLILLEALLKEEAP